MKAKSLLISEPQALARAEAWHGSRCIGTRVNSLDIRLKQLWMLSLVSSFIITGCALPSRAIQPAHRAADLNDIRFTHYLASVHTVTVDEGMRAVLMLIGDTKQWPAHEDRSLVLESRGAFKSSWGLGPNQILDHGTLAYMLRNVCDIAPGLNESLATYTGLGDRRYALKTCIYEGVLPYTQSQKPVSGGEMHSALTRAENRIKGISVNSRKNP